jgi:hypothetical protein
VTLGERLDRHFRAGVVLTCAGYALLAGTYAVRLPLVMDEFQGAYSARQVLTGMPYRDFLPYKTLLGYAVQTVPLALVDDHWTSLIVTRCLLVLLTAVGLGVAASWLARTIRPGAVLVGLALLACCSTFVERSLELRSDMLTSLVGLFALAALAERRPVLAGSLAALSFLVSQKGAYYCVAVGVATCAWWAFVQRDRRAGQDVLRAALAGLLPILAYVVVWSLLASPGAVIESTFIAAGQLALADVYRIRPYWFQTVMRNPLLWSLAVLALGALFARRRDRPEWRDWSLLAWGLTLAVLSLWHAQPWPYFFVLVLPTAAVLAARLLEDELSPPSGPSLALVTTVALLGFAWPLGRLPVVLQRDSAYQRHVVRLAEAVVEPGEPYLAGLQLLDGRQHVPERLSWLDSPARAQLARADAAALVRELEARPPKAVVWNYRLEALPRPAAAWLAARYVRLSADVLVVAPSVPAGATSVDVPHDGRYAVDAPSPVDIDGSTHAPGSRVQLTAGAHDVRCASAFRLQLFPEEAERRLDRRWHDPRPLFGDVYDF